MGTLAALIRSKRERAIRALELVIPQPIWVLTDFERWRAKEACRDRIDARVTASIVEYRRRIRGHPPPEDAREKLILSVAPLLPHAEVDTLRLAARSAAMYLSALLRIARNDAISPVFAGWLLLRVCAFDDVVLRDLQSALAGRANDAALRLMQFEISLLTGGETAAADIVPDLVDIVDNPAVLNELLEFRGLVLLTSGRSEAGATLLEQVRAGTGPGLERLTAYCLGRWYASVGRIEEANSCLANLEEFRCEKPGMSASSTLRVAPAVAAALGDDTRSATRQLEDVLRSLADTSLWPDTAALTAALRAETLGRAKALDWLDDSACEAAARWERQFHSSNSFLMAQIFWEEGASDRARRWARQAASSFEGGSFDFYFRSMKRLATAAGDSADWAQFEDELRALLP